MSSSSERVLVTGIPLKDKTIDGSQLPLIFLTDVDDEQKNQLVEHLKGNAENNGQSPTLHPWHPSPETLQSIVKPDSHLDSQANIHAVAVLAARAGYTGLLVADELTKRQLTGNLRVGEYPTISVVMVSIRRVRAPGAAEDQIRIVAKRTAGPTWPRSEDEHEIVYEDFLAEMESFELLPLHRKESPFADCGLALHDPDQRPFTPDSTGVMGREKDSEAHGLTELPDGIKHLGNHHLNVFLLFPAMPEEQQATESILQKTFETIQQNLQKETSQEESKDFVERIHVHAIPWEHHHVTGTRRQLLALWNAYQSLVPLDDIVRDIFLLDAPIHDQTNVKLKVVSSTIYGGTYITHLTPPQILPLWNTSWVGNWSHPKQESPDCELLYQPDDPFYVSTPPWQPTTCFVNWVSVFYLTNKLTAEKDSAIRDELSKFDPGFDWKGSRPKTACFVPWTPPPTDDDPARDGALEDMWDIFWKLYTYKRGRSVPYGTSVPTFFIDQQSAIDKTVIAVYADYMFRYTDDDLAREVLSGVDLPKVKGMVYNRVPASQAHSLFMNVGVANMGFDEFGDRENMGFFPRPGWPGHGVLVDADEGM
ncbi:hypothetical protein BJX65DRAFT_318293 [Aspergillus insuetus]